MRSFTSSAAEVEFYVFYISIFLGMLTRGGLRAFATEALKIINNVARQQFVTTLHGAEATIDYETSGKVLTLNRTDVPPQFQGKGVGKLLAAYAFDHAKEKKLDVVVKCHFLAKYYEDNIIKYRNLKVKIEL